MNELVSPVVGFTEMEADELYFINGGSEACSGLCAVGCVVQEEPDTKFDFTEVVIAAGSSFAQAMVSNPNDYMHGVAAATISAVQNVCSQIHDINKEHEEAHKDCHHDVVYGHTNQRPNSL